MSAHLDSPFAARRWIGGGLVVALAGALALGVQVAIDPGAALVGYLVGYTYWSSLVVGALLLLMICHAMHAGWPVMVRRLLESVTAVLPLLGVLSLPVLAGVRRIYPWASGVPVDDHLAKLLEHKRPYLNAPFFVARAIFYFVVWVAVAELLRAWSLRRDRDPEADVAHRLYAFSAAALPAVALTLAFSAIDWLMSLTPAWVSTMFPVCVFGGGFLAAIALLTLLTARADRAGLLPASPSHYYALGRLLLAFTIFWAYAEFFQFMLIWIADKPDEVAWFVPRMRGAGAVLSVILVAAHFALPFVVLLNYRLKRVGGALAVVAGWLLVAHAVDVLWLVTPDIRPGAPITLGDFGGLALVTGAVVAFGAWRQRGRALVAFNDPRLPEALRYEST